jgi:hypothetical protein
MKEVVQRSANNDKLNVKLLILAMVSTSKEYRGYRQGKPGLSLEKAVWSCPGLADTRVRV